jgi:hypothetical protein
MSHSIMQFVAAGLWLSFQCIKPIVWVKFIVFLISGAADGLRALLQNSCCNIPITTQLLRPVDERDDGLHSQQHCWTCPVKFPTCPEAETNWLQLALDLFQLFPPPLFTEFLFPPLVQGRDFHWGILYRQKADDACDYKRFVQMMCLL